MPSVGEVSVPAQYDTAWKIYVGMDCTRTVFLGDHVTGRGTREEGTG
jgi:hypothetical protein